LAARICRRLVLTLTLADKSMGLAEGGLRKEAREALALSEQRRILERGGSQVPLPEARPVREGG
jgi:hypothetical protein